MMNKAKNVKELKAEAIKNRLTKMIEIKKQYLQRIESEGWDMVAREMKLQRGNEKTGQACWTISLIPIHDCVNCSECAGLCYDIRNDCIYPSVLNDRAKNSALKESNPEKFWNRVDELIKENFVTELRINVGGDLRDYDFELVNNLGKSNSRTDILFFTKNYNGVDIFLDNNEFVSNVHAIRSCWLGMETDNRHNMPCSHVLWADGRTTAPEFGAKYCGGNCTECNFKGEGCWALSKREDVIFLAH